MQDMSGAGHWWSLPNHQKGKLGEELAVDWLHRHEFGILLRNFRLGRFEMDIVAVKNKILYGIEVKCRSGDQYGSVEEYFSAGKLKQMECIGSHLLDTYPCYESVNLILLNILLSKKNIVFTWVNIG